MSGRPPCGPSYQLAPLVPAGGAWGAWGAQNRGAGDVLRPAAGSGVRPAPSATRDGLPDPRGLAHRARGAAQPPCTAQAALCKPRRAVESADAMSTIFGLRDGGEERCEGAMCPGDGLRGRYTGRRAYQRRRGGAGSDGAACGRLWQYLTEADSRRRRGGEPGGGVRGEEGGDAPREGGRGALTSGWPAPTPTGSGWSMMFL